MKKRRQRSYGRVSMVLWLILIVMYSILFFSMRNLKAQVKDMQSGIEALQRGTGTGSLAENGDGAGSVNGDGAGSVNGDGTGSVNEYGDNGWADGEEAYYASTIPVLQVDKPVERTRTEALEYLQSLAADNETIREICDNSARYPERLLTALANNPEMADFALGYLTGKTGTSGGLTQAETREEFPLLLQWDPRWGYESYGEESNIGLSGCGPTCISMVMFYFTRNEELTPDVIAAYSETNGYYVEGTGTAWALMEDMPKTYGITVSKPKVSKAQMQNLLEQGGVIICAMGKGDFTVSGHFIVIYGYDKEGFLVNDPNCVARSRKKWTYDEISGQIKGIWGYRKT